MLDDGFFRLLPNEIGAPDWVIPAVVVAFVIAAITSWSYWRTQAASLPIKGFAASAKIIGVAIICLCLVNPLNRDLRPRKGENAFAILVDNSKSMRITHPDNSADDAGEISAMLKQTSPWRVRLEEDFDVRTYAFDARVQGITENVPLNFDGNVSSLRESLQTITKRFTRLPLSGILLFSDGNATDLTGNVNPWENMNVPVFPVIRSSVATLRDVGIENISTSQTNFEAAPVTIDVTVRCLGVKDHRIIVQLIDDQKTVVQAESVTPTTADERLEVRFRFRPQAGTVSFYHVQAFLKSEETTFQTNTSQIEVTLKNNSRPVVVDRGNGPFRVLYVAGRPNWEFKFIRRALQEDDEIQLVGLLRIARREAKFSFRDKSVDSANPLFQGFKRDDEESEGYAEPVLVRLGIENDDELRGGFPKSTDQLFAYHAIILDDIEAAFFNPDQLQLLRQFVSTRGGGLLMLGGQESFVNGGYAQTPLGELSPVYLDKNSDQAAAGPYRFDLTREGWLQPWMRVRSTETAERKRLAGTPQFETLNPASQIKPGASVLATVQTTNGTHFPALAVQRFGKGRSAALLVGDMWRWAMHRQYDDDRDLEQAWRQSIRWMVADVPRRMEVRVKQTDKPDRPLSLELTLRDEEFEPLNNATVHFTITNPNEEIVDLSAEASDREAGLYVAQFWPQDSGAYHLRASAVGADGADLGTRKTGFAAEPDAEELHSLQTNRKILDTLATQTGGEILTSNELDTFVTELPQRENVVTEHWVSPYWHQPWVLTLAMVLLCAEWGLRRWKGLP